MEPNGSERVSGVWIRARKLEGELDVGGRRILCPTGESIVVTAEPAWFWTSTKPKLGFPSTCVIAGRENDTSPGSGGFIAL